MDYIDRIIEKNITAKEIIDGFNGLRPPKPGDTTTILEENAIPLLMGVAAIGILAITKPGNEAEKANIFATAICNAFAAGMIAGMDRVEGNTVEIQDYEVKLDEENAPL